MDFSQREIAQFAALLCRYPDFAPPNEDEEEEVKQTYRARLQWEKQLLGRKFTVKKEGVDIFTPAIVSPSRSTRNILHATVIDGVRLCGHHSVGKKRAFARFLKTVALDLENTMSRYAKQFNTATVREWMGSNLNILIANTVANTHTYITQTAWLVEKVLSGKECYYGDLLYVQTDCKACQISSFVSVTTVLHKLTHIINAVGSDFLKSFLSHVYVQVNAMMPSTDLETVSSWFPDLTLVENMIIDPPDEPLHAFQTAIANREKMSKSKNNKSGDTVSVYGSEEERVATVSGVDVVVGESSKSFGGKRDDDKIVETVKSRAVGIKSFLGKGKGKEISSQEW